MNEKFMKVVKIVIPTVTVILIASQLFGVPATNQQGMLDMMQNSSEIELEIAIPKDEVDDMIDEVQGTESKLFWAELQSIDTYMETLRTPIENKLGISVNTSIATLLKTGMLYETNEGVSVPNNTLKGALQNKEFRAALENAEILELFSDAACNTYADLEADEETKNVMMAINAYFNLLPDTDEGYSNADAVVSREQFMAMVMRAETPYDLATSVAHKVDESFANAVGKSEYNFYSQYLKDDSYLTIKDGSLTESTINTSISRAEAVYMLMNHYFADELKSIDTSKVKLEDVTDGGNIVEKQNFTDKTGANALALNYALNNPDKGVPTDIYKALVLAESKGIIDSETEWDSGITKADSIEMLVNIYKSLPIEQTYGDIVHEDGSLEYVKPDTGLTLEEYDKKKEEGTLTKEDMLSLGLEDMSLEEFYKRGEDGCLYGDVVYTDENITYILLDDGTKIFPGDKFPDGGVYGGRTQEDYDFAANREY